MLKSWSPPQTSLSPPWSIDHNHLVFCSVSWTSLTIPACHQPSFSTLSIVSPTSTSPSYLPYAKHVFHFSYTAIIVCMYISYHSIEILCAQCASRRILNFIMISAPRSSQHHHAIQNLSTVSAASWSSFFFKYLNVTNCKWTTSLMFILFCPNIPMSSITLDLVKHKCISAHTQRETAMNS